MSTDFKLRSLIVEGPDDGAVVNALIFKRLDLDLSEKRQRVVKVADGVNGAISQPR